MTDLIRSRVWKCMIKIVREVTQAQPNDRLALADKIATIYFPQNPRLATRLALTGLRIVAWMAKYDENANSGQISSDP